MNRDRKNPLKKKKDYSVSLKKLNEKKNMRPDVPYILCAGRFFALSFFFFRYKTTEFKRTVFACYTVSGARPPQPRLRNKNFY